MNNLPVTLDQRPVVVALAEQTHFSPVDFIHQVRRDCMPNPNVSDAEVLNFLALAKARNLDPLKREIYCLPGKGGKTQTVVALDGAVKIAVSHSDHDGHDFKEIKEDGKVVAVTATIWRKSWSHPVVVTEYMSECYRPTDPWKKWPIRMLRNKTMMQCVRMAYGFSEAMDSDEYERMMEAEAARAKPQVREEREVVSVSGADLDEVLFHIDQASSIEALEALKQAIMQGRFDLAEGDMQTVQAQYGMRMQALMANAPAIEQGVQQ